MKAMISKMSSCYEAQAGDDGGAWLVPTLALAELHLICMCSTLTLQHRDREMRNAISSRADQSAFMTHDSWIEVDIFCEEWEQHKAN